MGLVEALVDSVSGQSLATTCYIPGILQLGVPFLLQESIAGGTKYQFILQMQTSSDLLIAFEASSSKFESPWSVLR